MDIKELTEKYRERFEAFYHTEGSNTDRKGNRRKRTEESPSFLKEVIRPILDIYRNCYQSMALPKPRMSTPCTGNITVLRQALYLLEDFL